MKAELFSVYPSVSDTTWPSGTLSANSRRLYESPRCKHPPTLPGVDSISQPSLQADSLTASADTSGRWWDQERQQQQQLWPEE